MCLCQAYPTLYDYSTQQTTHRNALDNEQHMDAIEQICSVYVCVCLCTYVLIEFYRSTMCCMCDAFQWNDNINSGLISTEMRKHFLCTFCFPRRFKRLLVLTHLGVITVLPMLHCVHRYYKSDACNGTKSREYRVIRMLFFFTLLFCPLLFRSFVHLVNDTK